MSNTSFLPEISDATPFFFGRTPKKCQKIHCFMVKSPFVRMMNTCPWTPNEHMIHHPLFKMMTSRLKPHVFHLIVAIENPICSMIFPGFFPWNPLKSPGFFSLAQTAVRPRWKAKTRSGDGAKRSGRSTRRSTSSVGRCCWTGLGIEVPVWGFWTSPKQIFVGD